MLEQGTSEGWTKVLRQVADDEFGHLELSIKTETRPIKFSSPSHVLMKECRYEAMPCSVLYYLEHVPARHQGEHMAET